MIAWRRSRGGVGAMGQAFYKGGFEPRMSRKEASLILSLKSVILPISPSLSLTFYMRGTCVAPPVRNADATVVSEPSPERRSGRHTAPSCCSTTRIEAEAHTWRPR